MMAAGLKEESTKKFKLKMFLTVTSILLFF